MTCSSHSVRVMQRENTHDFIQTPTAEQEPLSSAKTNTETSPFNDRNMSFNGLSFRLPSLRCHTLIDRFIGAAVLTSHPFVWHHEKGGGRGVKRAEVERLE